MTDLDGQLRDEAKRDPTRFDEARHARLMGHATTARPTARPRVHPMAAAMLLAAGVAIGVLAWPREPARRLELPGVPSSDVASLVRRPIEALKPPGVAEPADRLAAFVSGQLGVVGSLREARRPT